MVSSNESRRAGKQKRGAATRAALVVAAADLITRQPVLEVSVAQIADAAGVFPNQVTYYFGSKDALLIEGAFGLLLRDAQRLERLGDKAATASRFREVMARAGLALPSSRIVVQALALAGRNPELTAIAQARLGVLFRQSERYLDQVMTARGWTTTLGTRKEVLHFWAVILGCGLITGAGFPGTSQSIALDQLLHINDTAH